LGEILETLAEAACKVERLATAFQSGIINTCDLSEEVI